MKISKETAEILGLSKAELSIIDSLESKDQSERNMSIVNISKETNIPRTSLYYMLPKLERRGFIEMKRNNKRVYWRKSTDEYFEGKYIRTIESVIEKKINPISPTADNQGIRVLRGTDQLLTVFNEIAGLHTKSRAYGIQPDASLVQVVKNVPTAKAIKFCDDVKEKGIIIEAIVHEKSVDSIKNTLTDKRTAQELLKSFGGRSADTVKMPDNFLSNTKAESYLYDNKVSLLNWEKGIAVIIEDNDIFHLVKEMFNSTKYLMERYDQNEKIAKKLVDFEI